MVPYVPAEAIGAVSNVLLSRWIGQGPKVEEFERRFSEQIAGGRASVATGSCTDALHLAYLLAGIGPGDEVIAPLFTCTATNIPLLYCGATIRFCDVAPDSLNMDPVHCKSLLTERTKAIVVVNYGGAPVSKDFFNFGTPVIEDCAQSLGGRFPIRGKYACFSFQAVKHIGTGDGGMLVCPEGLQAKAKRIRWFGIDRAAKLAGTWANDITELGYKYQMNDIAAAMGIEGLNGLDSQMRHRRKLRSAYFQGVLGVSGITLLDTDGDSACWLCTVAVERRDDFKRKLFSEGIESDQTHYRNDRYTIFKQFVGADVNWPKCREGQFPNMDAIDSKYLVLPMHMGMDIADVEHICAVIRSGW